MKPHPLFLRPVFRGTACSLLLATALLAVSHAQAQLVSQTPLHVRGNIPGNLALVPSVEYPTILSVANIDDTYSSNTEYAGYFDSGKCYQYHYSDTEAERHFYPVSTTTNRRCTDASAPWSGNFLNWAATQTIDPFRKALTGGHRVRDTTTETWLEKAHHDRSSEFPNRSLSGSSVVSGATPYNTNSFHVRIQGLGNQMHFRAGNSGVDQNVHPYNPGANSNNAARTCSSNACTVSIRVKVCDAQFPEDNCTQYGSNWKPEGTLQEYAERMRYAAFGYLNDHNADRDGGVLRARMKYIGPKRPNALGTLEDNPEKEWNPSTGVLLDNPNPTDASATSSEVNQGNGGGSYNIQYSGVINYINRFGQMTSKQHKSHDPVGELYYAALRYLRNQGNVSSYSNISGSRQNRFELADGFPVITSWDDPVQHWCQSNVILGIGDIYTHRDKNLPGNTSCRSSEPSMPTAVSSDTTMNVVTLTNQVFQMEGFNNLLNQCEFTGRSNSAYLAGMAWDARSRDNRPDLEGARTTISTYWVDVLEARSLEGMARNQYALTAKYGGAKLPIDFNRSTWGTAPLPEAWWHTNGDTLTPHGNRGSGQTAFKRPDNFFTAGRAADMVESLTSAFASIAAEQVGTGASLATMSSSLDTGTRIFQSQFFSGSWRGELTAYEIHPDTGALVQPPAWTAGSAFPSWSNRKIYFHDTTKSGDARHALFSWGNLGTSQRAALGNSADIVNYLRGDRSKEQSQSGGTLRTRSGVLGDIVHSEPLFIGQPVPALHTSKSYAGSSAYPAFVNNNAARTPLIYVGANDGMLHAFNAETGQEHYAFIPATVIQNGLKDYTQPDYEHRYFVDGELTAAAVWDGSAWKTVLAGTLGRGGPGIFALDITEPGTASKPNIRFLWEKSGAAADGIPDLGRNIGKPIIAQVANAKWKVLLGNGVDSGNGAQLIMIDALTGEHETISLENTPSNGLSAVYTWDSDGDGFMDTAYAGDLRGNLWRINNLGRKDGEDISTTLLFSQSQPSTAPPLVATNPRTAERWVFFGTGRYLGEADRSSTAQQTWYGLIDSGALAEGALISGRDVLVQRRVLAEGVVGDFKARVIEEGSSSDFEGKHGWYIDLPNSGERMVVPNFFRGPVLMGTSRIPESHDICRPSGNGWVMAIDPFTGGRLNRVFFDLTLDGLFNSQDMLNVNGTWLPVSGVGFDSAPNRPVFIGNTMQTSLDDGRTQAMGTNSLGTEARRTSWRELIGN